LSPAWTTQYIIYLVKTATACLYIVDGHHVKHTCYHQVLIKFVGYINMCPMSFYYCTKHELMLTTFLRLGPLAKWRWRLYFTWTSPFPSRQVLR
jgi:hypothetical protein